MFRLLEANKAKSLGLLLLILHNDCTDNWSILLKNFAEFFIRNISIREILHIQVVVTWLLRNTAILAWLVLIH